MIHKNNKRFDLSDYLIHFFRKIDLSSLDAPVVPESMGFSNLHEDCKWSAIFMLRCAVRYQRLWATWSYRGGSRTIYGPYPAVCFTEMPIAAFLETSVLREERGEAMSPYALVFKRDKLYAKGANPVIYGLDNRNAYLPSGKNGAKRIIEKDLLPLREQYRYVTFNPLSPKKIDWTHEREWRWPYTESISSFEKRLEEGDVITEVSEIPSMNLTSSHCTGMGVIVRTVQEASWVSSDILTLVDRSIIGRNHISFILVSELLMLADLKDPEEVNNAISNAVIDIRQYFSMDPIKMAKISKRFTKLVQQIEDSVPHIEEGNFGGVWLWILDNTSKLARSLINEDRLQVSNDGRYLVELFEFDDGRSLNQREQMVRALAKLVKKEFSVECGYFSVDDSDDFNQPSFRHDDHLDNRMFYNVSW